MIVIPRLLTEQVRAGDEALQKRLALDFAQHGLDACRSVIENASTLDAYLDSARRYLHGESPYEKVLENYERSHDPFAEESFAKQVAWGVHNAVMAAARRAFEEPGTYMLTGRISANDVATLMQRIAGDHAAFQAGLKPDDPSAKTLVWHTRWEEARWQLVHTIELAPNPHHSQPDEGSSRAPSAPR